MSGHSKWATIKHKKGALDAKRGKIFTRLIKEIAMAAKNGGDPDMNPRLRTAILAAKAENMPADNIKRAIQRGTGELPGLTYEEFVLEGYGPGGVALLAEISTDNRNRTVSEIRHVFGKNNGNMAEAGAVSWMFHKKGDIVVPKSDAKEDDLMNMSQASYFAIWSRFFKPSMWTAFSFCASLDTFQHRSGKLCVKHGRNSCNLLLTNWFSILHCIGCWHSGGATMSFNVTLGQ